MKRALALLLIASMLSTSTVYAAGDPDTFSDVSEYAGEYDQGEYEDTSGRTLPGMTGRMITSARMEIRITNRSLPREARSRTAAPNRKTVTPDILTRPVRPIRKVQSPTVTQPRIVKM